MVTGDVEQMEVEEKLCIKTSVDDVDAAAVQKENDNYETRKNIAQGMMDIALITANANQLRYLIEYNNNSPTYGLVLVLICISLVLQVAVGVSLIYKGQLDLTGTTKPKKGIILNNCVTIAILLITVINVFVASFTVTGTVVSDVSAASVVSDVKAVVKNTKT